MQAKTWTYVHGYKAGCVITFLSGIPDSDLTHRNAHENKQENICKLPA